MECKVFLCFLVIVFVNVQCNAVTTSTNAKLKRSRVYIDSDEIRKQNYNGNRPPSADEYESIPVAVVLHKNHEVVTESLRSSSNSENVTKATNEEFSSSANKIDIHNISKINSNESYRIALNIDTTEVNKDAHFLELKLINTNSSDQEKLKGSYANRSSKNRNMYEVPVEVVYKTGGDQSKSKLGHNIDKEQRKQTQRNSTQRMRGNKHRTQKSNNEFATEPHFETTTSDVTENIKLTEITSFESVRGTASNTEQEAKNIDAVTLKANNSGSDGVKKLPKKEFKRRSGNKTPVVPIVDSENFLSLKGSFHYKYEGGDGTKAYEQGELKTLSDERTGEAVVGGYSYKDKDGNQYELTYTADENGYRPVGAHLPTPPPVPPAIARALAHLATKTTPEPVTEPDAKLNTTQE